MKLIPAALKAPSLLSALAVVLLATVTPASAQLRLTNPENTANGNFGASIVFAGPYVCIGAPSAEEGGVASGAVFVFNAFTGGYVGKICRASGAQGDRFGEAITSVGGSRLFIGCPGAGPALSQGRVYEANLPIAGTVFTNTWRDAPDAASNSGFGASVAANASTVAIGAPDAQLSKGRAYTATNPLGPAALATFGPGPQDSRYGAAVGLIGNTLLIGAPNYAGAGAQSGGVFRANGTVILPAGIGAFSQFGASIASMGSLAVIGAPDEDNATPSTNVGAVYLIEPQGGGVVARYQPASLGNSGRLGTSVAASGALIFSGAPYATDPNTGGIESGAFVLIDRSLPAYDPFPIAPGGLAFQDRFGQAIAATPGLVAIGAPEQHVSGAVDAGAVYVYRTDAALPVVTPKPKKVKASRTAATVLLKGRASGGFGGITRVQYAVKRNGPFKALNGTAQWRGKARIKKATKKVFVRALDAAGRPSSLVSVRIVHSRA